MSKSPTTTRSTPETMDTKPEANPRTQPTAAYAAFMGMENDEWKGLFGSLTKGGVLTPAEQRGFDQALRDRGLPTESAPEVPLPDSQTFLPTLPFPDDDDSWREEAECRHFPDLDFHNGGQKSQCTAVCRTCPVTSECLAFAVKNKIEYGVYGGVTASIRKQNRIKAKA